MHTLLIAHPDRATREFLTAQLDADGYTVHEADSIPATTAKLSAHAIDVLILADLQRPADAPALVRSLRAGQLHTRVHPAQPVITLGAPDELSTLRAYQAGSDHHLSADSTYLILRAVIDAITRRTVEHVTSRHVHVDSLHIDTAARIADVNGTPVDLGRREYEVLATLASDPNKVFSKDELARRVWGQKAPLPSSRTVECHVARVRPARRRRPTHPQPQGRRLGPQGAPHERAPQRTSRRAAVRTCAPRSVGDNPGSLPCQNVTRPTKPQHRHCTQAS